MLKPRHGILARFSPIVLASSPVKSEAQGGLIGCDCTTCIALLYCLPIHDCCKVNKVHAKMVDVLDDKSEHCMTFILDCVKKRSMGTQETPLFIAVNGAQGSGKTTLVSVVCCPSLHAVIDFCTQISVYQYSDHSRLLGQWVSSSSFRFNYSYIVIQILNMDGFEFHLAFVLSRCFSILCVLHRYQSSQRSSVSHRILFRRQFFLSMTFT